jgi:hypothetical protein
MISKEVSHHHWVWWTQGTASAGHRELRLLDTGNWVWWTQETASAGHRELDLLQCLQCPDIEVLPFSYRWLISGESLWVLIYVLNGWRRAADLEYFLVEDPCVSLSQGALHKWHIINPFTIGTRRNKIVSFKTSFSKVDLWRYLILCACGQHFASLCLF